MPAYDYLCPTNGRVLEVKHKMSDAITTWGELCAAAAIEPGDTAPEAPVERLISEGSVVDSRALKNPEGPPCGGGGCGGGRCAFG